MSVAFVDLLIEHLPELPGVLNAGTDAALHWIADAGEDLLATFVPAYGIARSTGLMACASLPNMTAAKCEGELTNIKYKLFDEFARLTGLRSIVAGIIEAWKLIPAAVRELVAGAGAALQTASKALSAVKDGLAAFVNFDPAAVVKNLVSAPGLLAKAGLDMFKSTFGAAASLTTMWTDITGKVGEAIKVPILRELVTGIIKIADVPIKLLGKAAEAAAWLTGKMYELGRIGLEHLKAAAKWLFERFKDAGTAIVNAFKDAGAAVGNAIVGFAESLADLGGDIIDTLGDALPWNWDF